MFVSSVPGVSDREARWYVIEFPLCLVVCRWRESEVTYTCTNCDRKGSRFPFMSRIARQEKKCVHIPKNNKKSVSASYKITRRKSRASLLSLFFC